MKIISIFFFAFITNLNAVEGMPQFNSTTFPSQLFWLVISFLTLYILISLIVLPRIRENLRLRKNKISNDIDRASNIKDQVETMLGEYDKKIEDANNKAKELIKNSFKKSEEDLKSQLLEAKKQLDTKLRNTEIKLASYKKEILTNLSDNSIYLSDVIIRKLFSEQLKDNEIKELLNNKRKSN